MSKPSTKPAHPPYSKMIVEAIAALKDRKGSSRQALVKYIKGNYTGIGDNCSSNVNKKLKVLKEEGIVKEGSGGPYKFALTDAGKAKPKPKPKPAVKKPAPKKAKKSDKKASAKKPTAKKPTAKKASDKKSTPKKAGTAKKGKTPTKKSKPKSPAKKAGKKPTPKKTGKKPAAKKSQKK